jgi:hypothetical protein
MKENALVIGKIYKDIKKDNNVWKRVDRRGDMKGRREGEEGDRRCGSTGEGTEGRREGEGGRGRQGTGS